RPLSIAIKYASSGEALTADRAQCNGSLALPMEEDMAIVEDLVQYEARDGRAYITFNRPEKKNALTHEMLAKLGDYLDLAQDDDDVRVVIYRSSGNDFCAGHDLSEVGAEYGPPQLDKNGKPRRPSQRARIDHDRK